VIKIEKQNKIVYNILGCFFIGIGLLLLSPIYPGDIGCLFPTGVLIIGLMIVTTLNLLN